MKTRGSSSWPNADGCAASPPRLSRTPLRSHFLRICPNLAEFVDSGRKDFPKEKFSEERS